jgi:hypothetical protein
VICSVGKSQRDRPIRIRTERLPVTFEKSFTMCNARAAKVHEVNNEDVSLKQDSSLKNFISIEKKIDGGWILRK